MYRPVAHDEEGVADLRCEMKGVDPFAGYVATVPILCNCSAVLITIHPA